jgi:sigma-B regulation protein RsbU (phosphoserine phosphatase)
MAVSRTLIRATGIRGVSASECMTYSNGLLAQESANSMFVTVFYGILNTKTGEVSYCNAGHNPPYVLKKNGEVTALPMSEDPMVGAIDGIEFHEASLQLEHGDSLVMFTDGVTEAEKADQSQYGEERLLAWAKNLSETLPETSPQEKSVVESLHNSVTAFVDGNLQNDDITIISLKL